MKSRSMPLSVRLFVCLVVSLISCFATETKALAYVNRLQGYVPEIDAASTESAALTRSGEPGRIGDVQNLQTYDSTNAESASSSMDYGSLEPVWDDVIFAYRQGGWNTASSNYISVNYFSDTPIGREGERLYYHWASKPVGLGYRKNARWYTSRDTELYWTKCWTWDSGEWTELEIDAEGFVTMPYDVFFITFTAQLSGIPTDQTRDWIFINQPYLLYLEDSSGPIDRQTQQISQEMESQTEALMDTQGSGQIVIDNQQYVSQVTGKLGFVQQAAQTVTGIFDAVGNTSERNSITFPGISWNGFQIQATEVPLRGYLGQTVEDRICDGVTFVFVLAWISGMLKLYDRIFHGEKDVITE